MSHPPETSLTSRELAERVWRIWDNKTAESRSEAATLIDAWVRMREEEAVSSGVKLCAEFLDREADANFMPNEPAKLLLHGMASALRLNLTSASAEVELKGGPHGQDEAPIHGEAVQGEPSDAASANSEPGGA